MAAWRGRGAGLAWAWHGRGAGVAQVRDARSWRVRAGRMRGDPSREGTHGGLFCLYSLLDSHPRLRAGSHPAAGAAG
eukprot:gene16762-biopygen762